MILVRSSNNNSSGSRSSSSISSICCTFINLILFLSSITITGTTTIIPDYE